MKKTLIGTVVSDKMQKTIIVSVDTLITAKKYKKQITRQKKYYVHDEEEQARVGDKVQIQESRPRSKNKKWELLKILEK